tara:strand:- start:2 stop:232 length:231 start_codon:yes stop_codon:yes gene_type:complete
MKWPPTRCWTSPVTKNGNRHFQVKGYGGKKSNRWVELFATRDKSVVLRISWNDLRSQWKSGWMILPKDEDLKGCNI